MNAAVDLQDDPVDVANLNLERASDLLQLLMALGGDGIRDKLPAMVLEGNLNTLFGYLHDIGKAVDAMHAEHCRQLSQQATHLQAQGGAA